MKKLFPAFALIIGILIGSNTSQAAFTDVPPSHPNFKAISYLEKQGVVEGYADGTYRPDAFISRVETLKIILMGSNITIDENQSQSAFEDITAGVWYAKYVNKAKELGIVSGDTETGLFRPGDETNLAENLKILLKAGNRNTLKPNSNPYLDVPAEAWFAPYFAYAKNLAMFPQSSRENIQPGFPIRRGMMADLMYQLSFKPEGYQEGEASYYGLNLQGNGTASGERFDAYSLTAAHPTLPFGTVLRVTNMDNGKEIEVKVNDRGPYADGRIIDLSQAAFQAIAPLSQGVARVSILPVDAIAKEDPNDVSCKNREGLSYLPKDSFDNIQLDQELPNRFLSNEVLMISGTSTSPEKEVTAILVDNSGAQHPIYAKTDPQGKFELHVFFPADGQYELGLLPGTSGTSTTQPIQVLSSICQDTQVDKNLKSLFGLEAQVKEGNLELNWQDDQGYELKKVTFLQGEKGREYILNNENKITPHYADFEGWSKGQMEVQVQGAHLEGKSVLEDQMINWSTPIKKSLIADKHHQYILNKDEVQSFIISDSIVANQPLTIKSDPLVNINEKGLIITPSGQVESSIMKGNTQPLVNPFGVRIFPSAVNELQLDYIPKLNETHIFELNNEQGQAVVNLAVYPVGVYPILPNPIDLTKAKEGDLELSTALLRSYMLNLVNEDRTENGLNVLRLDEKLNDLAQLKTDDMVQRDYLSHWNPEGLTVNQLRKDFDIKQVVSENIALDSTPILAEYGLMSSGAHRLNLLKEEWTQVGLGITKDPKGGYLFVQVFSENPIDPTNLDELRGKVVSTINEARISPLTLQDNLNTVSQQWSDEMASKDFFGITSPNNTKLAEKIKDSGINEAMGNYLVGNSSFVSALEQIYSNTQLKDPRWKDIGVGIAQDDAGIIKITLTYTE